MNILKKKLSLILALIMFGIAIFPVINTVYAAEACQVSMTVKMGSTTMVKGGTYTVKGGETVTVTASSAYGIAFIGYRYQIDGKLGTITDGYSNKITFKVPEMEAGKTIVLLVEAVANNDNGTPNTITKTGWITYYLRYEYEDVSEKEITTTMNGKTLVSGKTYEAEVGTGITIKATPADEVTRIAYAWDNEEEISSAKSTVTLKVPTKFEEGEKHTLWAAAIYNDNTVLDWEKYYIVISGDNDVDEEDNDDELIIEPWMKENDELEQLAISLRNDSEDTKYNKNIYELDEEIIYYVDYKNGGKDITSKVTVILNLPLDFEVIDADGGVINENNRTITWTWNNGLESDQAGTREVVLKYISLGKSSIDYKIVNPIADIKKDTKVIDSSAVVNLIFKETDLEIDDTHYPYMYGDANATTFRPDDIITRAEAALVLTRIFGIYTNSIKITSVYPDLGETYEEAQKAIIAATSYGLLNGYTDGTYRPNEPMTRAEIMKIIAKRIEIQAEDDEIRGLEVKDYSSNIKIYKDPVARYIVNGQVINEHWAIDHVTLLARLNMTSVSNKAKDLRLDDYVTRAEVAQLVNFYLLRAPAKVTSRTISEFSDVLSSHKLFADIVEATRESHTYTLTSDGREIAK